MQSDAPESPVLAKLMAEQSSLAPLFVPDAKRERIPECLPNNLPILRARIPTGNIADPVARASDVASSGGSFDAPAENFSHSSEDDDLRYPDNLINSSLPPDGLLAPLEQADDS